MITEDETQAVELADELNSDNQERQVLCAEIFESALQMIESEHLKDNVLALASPDWNHGVIGIVASRLLDRFYLPVFIMAIEGDIAKGSVRCIDVPGLDIYEEMKNIQLKHNIFLKYGGHKMAAGFSVSSSRVIEFQKIIREHFLQLLSKKDISKLLKIDSAIRLQALSSNFLNRIAKLAP